MSGTGAEMPAQDFTADSAQPAEQFTAKTLQSQHFNDWLDRALPLLQEQLTDLGTSNITTAKARPKH